MTWNPADKAANLTLSNSDKTVTRDNTASDWRTLRSVRSRSSGKWYAELINVTDNPSGLLFGLSDTALSLTDRVGFSAGSYGLRLNSTANLVSYNNTATTTLVADGSASCAAGDRAMVAVDFGAGKIWFGTKGTWRNGNPAAGTGANYTFTPGSALYLCASLYAYPGVATVAAKSSDLLYTPPAGFEIFDAALALSGTVKDASGANAARTVRAYRRDTGVLVGSVVSNGTSGAFSVDTSYSGEHTVIALDDDVGDSLNAIVFDRVVPV